MPGRPNQFSDRLTLLLVIVCVTPIYVGTQIGILSALGWEITPRDSDDALRLIAVRNLLAGQDWFDTTQYRVLPPEGLDLHWSRLIDGALAGLNLVFRIFVPEGKAELLASYAWPGLLFSAFVLVTGFAAFEMRGQRAAVCAMLLAAISPSVVVLNFRFGRVDHHNFQILCIIVMVAAALSGERARRSGAIAGIAAGVSLAVGLEVVPVIAVVAVAFVVAFAVRSAGAQERLVGFSASFPLSVIVFFALQTDPNKWTDTVCDQIGWPVLLFPATVFLFSKALVLVLQTRFSVPARLLITVFLGAVAAMVCVGVYNVVCESGPYGVAPTQTASVVIAETLESLPLRKVIAASPGDAVNLAFPVLAALLLLISVWPKRPEHYLVPAILVAGLAGAFYQVRLLNWSVSVLPLAVGLGLDGLLRRDWKAFSLLKLPVVAIIVLAACYPMALARLSGIGADKSGAERALNPSDLNCANHAVLVQLGELPPALIFSPLNLGVPILFNTHHSVTAAPYHRSPEAMALGYAPFRRHADAFLAAVRGVNADYVVVCRGEGYGPPDSAGSRLAAGERINGLADIPLRTDALRLLSVLSQTD